MISRKLLSTKKQIVASTFSIISNVQVTNSGTIPIPNTVVAGDLLLVLAGAGGGSTTTPSITPTYGTGFTAINTVTGVFSISSYWYRTTGCASYKIATGAEAGTSIGGFVSSQGFTYMLFHIRGTYPIASVTANPNTNTVASTNPPLYTSTTTSTSDTVVYYHLVSGTSAIPAITSTSPTPTLSVTKQGGIYAGCASGVWISNTAQQYSFDAASSGNTQTRVPMIGHLILSY